MDGRCADDHCDRLPSRKIPKTMDAHGGKVSLWAIVAVMVVAVDDRCGGWPWRWIAVDDRHCDWDCGGSPLQQWLS